VTVWTSTLKRAVMTSAYLPTNYNFHQTTMLNEIYAGRCEGMTYGQVIKLNTFCTIFICAIMVKVVSRRGSAQLNTFYTFVM
jgi:hypothetical protein